MIVPPVLQLYESHEYHELLVHLICVINLFSRMTSICWSIRHLKLTPKTITIILTPKTTSLQSWHSMSWLCGALRAIYDQDNRGRKSTNYSCGNSTRCLLLSMWLKQKCCAEWSAWVSSCVYVTSIDSWAWRVYSLQTSLFLNARGVQH